jgi:hypothetical protein
MRKNIIPHEAEGAGGGWLDLAHLARVEVTSEHPGHPVESALVPGSGPGWRAAGSGPQVIRLRFDQPQHVRRLWLRFDEPAASRTQEFTLRWVAAGGATREVVRQQWTFSPGGSARETEDYQVDLPEAAALELAITPDISGGDAVASLAGWRVG